MLFFTVVFFAYYLILLFNGGLFKGSLIKSGELKIKLENNQISKKEFDDQNGKIGCLFVAFLIPFMSLQLVYMIMAINHKQFALISIAYFILYILWFFIGTKFGKKKYDLTNETEVGKYRKSLYKGRSFQGVVWNLISLAYFGYIGYLLLT